MFIFSGYEMRLEIFENSKVIQHWNMKKNLKKEIDFYIKRANLLDFLFFTQYLANK